MKIFDVRDQYTDIYQTHNGVAQKATSHLWWNEIKKQLHNKHSPSIVLLDESCFLWYHMTIRLNQSHILTRSQYKQLITQKVTEVQEELGVKPNQLTYSIKNMRINKTPVNRIIWESGTIVFDICFFVLDTQWSDIAQYQHVHRYPRRYFLLSHPVLAKKKQINLLVIHKHTATLIHLEHGWYKKIFHLNGWDDLLRQAYEQAGLDPDTTKQKSFDAESIGSKLLTQAHTQFDEVLLWWVQAHTEQGQDMMLISRLIEQDAFTASLSKEYITKMKGRLIPYRGSELLHLYGRTRSVDEMPAVLCLHRMKKK